MLGFDSVSFSWPAQRLLHDFSLTFAEGKTTALLGASGIGKSSLLQLLAGLRPIEQGKILVDRSQIAWMGQQDQLYPWLSVMDNVLLPSTLTGQPPDRHRAEYLLERVGLAHRISVKPHQLSGGMRQRVALARTLYTDRSVILMDEPFAMLDAITKLRLQTLTGELVKGKTVIMVTHDPAEACRLAEEIILLHHSPIEVTVLAAPAGAPPRPADDLGLLTAQAALLTRLEAYDISSE